MLSLPAPLRHLLAFDHALSLKVLAIHVRAITSFQRRRARRYGITDSKGGAITVIQRFGAGLRLNLHFHTGEELKCPVCSGAMEQSEHGYASQILVDACVAGCGLWLDKGELQALERFYEEASSGSELPLHWRIWASMVSTFKR